jgi:tagatose-1,6-bisphosphate aldolase
VPERSLRPIAGEDGVICLLALDHREALRNVFRRAGIENVTPEEMLAAKARIVEAVAAGGATGVLLDHEAARVCGRDGLGLLVPLEAQGHEELDGGRLNRLEFTAEEALRLGADGCKLLLHYRADHEASAERQRELVARAAGDCRRHGLPLVLEPLVYRLDGESEEAYAGAFGGLVVRGASDFAHSEADLLKLQYPGDAAACAALSEAASPLRWALLGGSEADGETFASSLDTACRAGAAGFMAGRAVWSGAIGLEPAAQERWLAEHARPLFERLAAVAHTHAAPLASS